MDACIASMYIPGLECAFTFTNNKEGAALIQMNSPETNITAIEIRRNNLFSDSEIIHFTLIMKVDTTYKEYCALHDMVSVPLQGASGKIYTDIQPAMYVATPHRDNEYWGGLFAAQSRKFTPFEVRPTKHVMMTVANVENMTEVCEVIEALLGLLGIFRDADTKPARTC